MADIDVKEKLDFIDYATVTAYRCCFLVAAIALSHHNFIGYFAVHYWHRKIQTTFPL
ncbi:MAG: hypothetical protein ACK5NC_15290 [Vibrio sp.]